VARGYVNAARFDEALVLLRGLEAALVLPDVPPAVRATVAMALADALRLQGSLVQLRSFAAAAEAAEHGVAAALSSGDPATLAATLLMRGQVAFERAAQAGEDGFDAAADDTGEALRWAELGGAAETACRARLLAGLIAERQGRFPEAVVHFRAALAESEAVGFDETRAQALRHLGFAAARAGQFEQAESFFSDALDLLQALGIGYALPFAYLALGELYAKNCDSTAARQQLETGLALAETSGNQRARMQLLVSLAEQAPAGHARELLARAAAAADALGHTQGQALIAARLGELGQGG
jgi:tetratricopeptide (TPR) repeat protein